MEKAERRSKRIRSPGYPSIGLAEAFEKAKMLYEKEGRHHVPISVAVQHWRYSPKSSGGQLCIAALKRFGLLTEKGKKGTRQVALSELAIRLIVGEDEQNPDFLQLLQTAALSPPIHRELWDLWGPRLPSDPAMKQHLLLDKNFNHASVDGFIRQFKETISFARLSDGDTRAAHRADALEARDERGGPLPSAGTPQATTMGGPRECVLNVPLIGGGMATLRVPLPLTEADYELLTGMLGTLRDKAKPAPVSAGNSDRQ